MREDGDGRWSNGKLKINKSKIGIGRANKAMAYYEVRDVGLYDVLAYRTRRDDVKRE